MVASALRPLSSRSSALLPKLASPSLLHASAQRAAFSHSQIRQVRLPHEAPSPKVAFLEKFSPVNHKVNPKDDPNPSARFLPRNDVKKVLICSLIFAGICYGIFLPADMPFLSEDEYKAFPVEWVETLGKTDTTDGRYKVLTLRLPDEHPMVMGNLKSETAPYHLMVKDPNLQIERPYTIFPPPPHVTGSHTQLSILVKREDAGEVSRYIHGLKRFDWPEIRGPIKTQTEDVRVGEQEGGEGWSLRGWDRVVMISGGTGVSPFFQLIHSLIPPERVTPLPAPTDLPTLTLIHASPTLTLEMIQEHLPEPERLPARLELVDLSPGRVTAESLKNLLFDTDKSTSLPSPTAARQSIFGKITSLFSSSPAPASAPTESALPVEDNSSRPTALSPTARTLFLVSGPDGLISAVSGPKGSQQIGGILGELGFGQQSGALGQREVRRFWNSPNPLRVGSSGSDSA